MGRFKTKSLILGFNFDLLHVPEGPALLRGEKIRHKNNC